MDDFKAIGGELVTRAQAFTGQRCAELQRNLSLTVFQPQGRFIHDKSTNECAAGVLTFAEVGREGELQCR
jgi:hypothetical protein